MRLSYMITFLTACNQLNEYSDFLAVLHGNQHELYEAAATIQDSVMSFENYIHCTQLMDTKMDTTTRQGLKVLGWEAEMARIEKGVRAQIALLDGLTKCLSTHRALTQVYHLITNPRNPDIRNHDVDASIRAEYHRDHERVVLGIRALEQWGTRLGNALQVAYPIEL